MKRLIIILMLGISLTLTACETGTEKSVQEFNDNSNFDIDLTEEVTDDIKADYTTVKGFGMIQLYDPSFGEVDESLYNYAFDEAFTYYEVTAYPDHSDGGSYLTFVTTSESKYNVFGLSVGDLNTKLELEEILLEYGYDLEDDVDFSLGHDYEFVNGKITINIYTDEDIITVIRVKIEVTNTDKIQF